MKKLAAFGMIAASIFAAGAVAAAGIPVKTAICSAKLAHAIPSRAVGAPSGSAVMKQVLNLSGAKRDAVVSGQLLSGNVPKFLRDLTPVTFDGTRRDGHSVRVTICVAPDYLAVGSNRDFVRIPMGLPAAARIAERFGFFLPTTKMVDRIYTRAVVHLTPSPMKPTRQMQSTAYLVRHNNTVNGQRAPLGHSLVDLTAGQKKDLVLTKRLLSAHGRVAIYGWQRPNGRPIQPLSTVHGAHYADYSHGIRLVSATAYVDGKARPLANILQDPQLASVVSSEGPIANPEGLLVSLYR